MRPEEQARHTWNRLSTDRTASIPDLAHNLSVMPLFSTMRISSEALREVCLEILNSSSGDARLVLDLGRHPTLGNDMNWVIPRLL
jgi:hypothetical protein